MAPIPERLKGTPIATFVAVAAQVETANPVISYWCNYWAVNQILQQKLHENDAQCLSFVTSLMDKLEMIKAGAEDGDAINNDVAGQTAVEQFANETFQRAERAVNANHATPVTAATYKAAGTFYEVLNVWGPPSAEVLAKIKYSKFHALRILRAIKEGKDPNASNPKAEPEPEPEEALPPLDPNDPEVLALSGDSISNKQPSVEEIPDEQDQVQSRLAATSILDRSLHPSAQPSARASPKPQELPATHAHNIIPPDVTNIEPAKDEVSPLESEPTLDNERSNSIGGGYFPEVPTFTSDTAQPTLPTAPATGPGAPGNIPFPASFPPSQRDPQPPNLPAPPQPPPDIARDFYNQPPQAPTPQQPHIPHHISSPPPTHPYFPQYTTPPPVQPPQPHFSQYAAPPPSAPSYVPLPAAPARPPVVVDDVAIAKAQKHAKWAISALNFEDTKTAIKELREALATLGA